MSFLRPHSKLKLYGIEAPPHHFQGQAFFYNMLLSFTTLLIIVFEQCIYCIACKEHERQDSWSQALLTVKLNAMLTETATLSSRQMLLLTSLLLFRSSKIQKKAVFCNQNSFPFSSHLFSFIVSVSSFICFSSSILQAEKPLQPQWLYFVLPFLKGPVQNALFLAAATPVPSL